MTEDTELVQLKPGLTLLQGKGIIWLIEVESWVKADRPKELLNLFLCRETIPPFDPIRINIIFTFVICVHNEFNAS